MVPTVIAWRNHAKLYERSARASALSDGGPSAISDIPQLKGSGLISDLIQELGKEARKLSPAERIQLVDEILSSLDQTSPALDAGWAAEVEDRIAAYHRGEIKALELSEVLSKYKHE
ncbi:MAG: addiction module protein [Betaproteobacteria bacterium]